MNVMNIVLLTGVAIVAIPLIIYLSVKLGRYAWLRATDLHLRKISKGKR